MSGNQRRGFGKPSHARSHDRNYNQNFHGKRAGPSDRTGEKRDDTPPRSPAPVAKDDLNAGPPAWLDAYLNNFKKEFIAEIAQEILKTLDVTFQSEAEKKRFKSSYFALRHKVARLEAKSADESGSYEKKFGRPNGRQRNTQNGRHFSMSKPEDPSQCSADQSETRDDQVKEARDTPEVEITDEPAIVENPTPEKSTSDCSLSTDKSDQNDTPAACLENILGLLHMKKPEEPNALKEKLFVLLDDLVLLTPDVMIKKLKELALKQEDYAETVEAFFQKSVMMPFRARFYSLMMKDLADAYNIHSTLREIITSFCHEELELKHQWDCTNEEKKETDKSEEAMPTEYANQKIPSENEINAFMSHTIFMGHLYNVDLVKQEMVENYLRYLLTFKHEIVQINLCAFIKIIARHFLSQSVNLELSFVLNSLKEHSLAENTSNDVQSAIKQLHGFIDNDCDTPPMTSDEDSGDETTTANPKSGSEGSDDSQSYLSL